MRLHKILLIEDEPDIRAVAEMALVAVGGYEVVVCASGVEGLERAPAFAPDLILLDVMMPGLDGPTTFVRLRAVKELCDVPIVFMTARSRPHEVKYYHELGALGVIEKPFDPMILPQRVQELWAA